MSKLTYVNIQGKAYPMSFSLLATKVLTERHGDISKYFKRVEDAKDELAALDTLSELLEVMIMQGCAYKNNFEANVPRKQNDPVDENGKFIPLSKEAIEAGLELSDLEYVSKKVKECIEKSSKTNFVGKANSSSKKGLPNQ